MRKGQATVFIALAILLALVFVLVYQFRYDLIGKARSAELLGTLTMPPEFNEIRSDIQQCIDHEAGEALALVGLQGGYIDLEDRPKTQWLGFNVSYLYYNDAAIAPSIQSIEDELSSHIAYSVLENCRMRHLGFNVTYSNVARVGADVEGRNVLVRMSWDIEVSKGGVERKFRDFSSSFEVRLAELASLAEEIANTYAERPDSLCMSCLIDAAKDRELTMELIARQDDLIFIINDPHSRIDDEYWRYVFAFKL